MILGPIFVGARCPLREQGVRLWSSDRSLWEQGAYYGSKVPVYGPWTDLCGSKVPVYGPWTDLCESKVPIMGARCPSMVLGPIFVGARCPLREQGARLWSSDRSLWEKGAYYKSNVPVYLPVYRALGVRCPFTIVKSSYDRKVRKNYSLYTDEEELPSFTLLCKL
nr:hypothetical protein Iba_chr07eCG6040 [Ipomoea batatas]